MSDFSLIKCPQFLDNAITPPAKEIGKTLGNIFYAIFSPINFNVEKLKIKHAENLKKYANDIRNELNKVPEDKLIEPKLSIIGPALEASKFYIEEEEMRKMFAKLIATTMNSDTSSKAHPSFIEIIKQLTPDEAKIISIYKPYRYYPLITVKAKLLNNKGYKTILENYSHIGIYAKCTNPNLTPSYLINLTRLGLGEITYNHYLTAKGVYDSLYNDPNIIVLCNKIKSNPEFEGFEIFKGFFKFSTFGEQFYEACVASKHV